MPGTYYYGYECKACGNFDKINFYCNALNSPLTYPDQKFKKPKGVHICHRWTSKLSSRIRALQLQADRRARGLSNKDGFLRNA